MRFSNGQQLGPIKFAGDVVLTCLEGTFMIEDDGTTLQVRCKAETGRLFKDRPPALQRRMTRSGSDSTTARRELDEHHCRNPSCGHGDLASDDAKRRCPKDNCARSRSGAAEDGHRVPLAAAYDSHALGAREGSSLGRAE